MIQLIRGFKDILPGEIELWQHIEKTAVALLQNFGFREIRVPIMEKTELFSRSIGEDTDIVEKEMYTFADRKGELLTLRPEATASVVRSYIQHKMYADQPVRRFYTIGPMFRRERPQKGRYRQFYQIDAEIFGVSSPLVDVELIYLLAILMRQLGVGDVTAHINSLGCPECRPNFKKALAELLDKVSGELCSDCLRRKDRNPMRVLDCKVPTCRQALTDAPSILDYLCPECQAHFAEVRSRLEKLKVPFMIDKHLVRGLDYYTRTAFEIQTDALGAQSAVAGGGRYDGLVKALGGPDQPAIGFAIGFDRLVEIVALAGRDYVKPPKVYIAALGERARAKAFDLRLELALAGMTCEIEHGDKSLKSQMKQADRINAAKVVIMGEAELDQQAVQLRDMQTKEQKAVPLSDIVKTLKAALMA